MQREILDEFTREVVKRTQKIKIGDPLLEDTRMGPLINRPHLERVLGFVKLAKEQVRNQWRWDGVKKRGLTARFLHPYLLGLLCPHLCSALYLPGSDWASVQDTPHVSRMHIRLCI